MMAFFRFANIANLLTDILILAMPIPIVWSLRLDRQKKFGVCGLFLLGGFVCVASIMRFYYLESVGKGVDPTCGFPIYYYFRLALPFSPSQ